MIALAPDRARAARAPALPPPGRAAATVSRLLAELGAAPARDPKAARGARPGDVVGRFRLVREIGRGGFGVVFEARAGARRRPVAIKTARPGARAGAARETLERELEVAHLRHPNVHVALEGGRCDAGPFVVFERLAGETLADRLARGPLPLERTIAIAAAVAAALGHAHGRGVLHRDVKPANVFLPRGGAPKLIDFGLAGVKGRAGPRGSGTPRYMAPEQRRGETEDGRTDLFALGCLIREMLAAAPARRAAGAVAEELERLAGALAADDPALRPGAAAEAIGALRTMQRALRAGSRGRGGEP